MNYETIKVRLQEPVCFLQFHRPEANNTINDLLIEEFGHALAACDDAITVVVLEGLPEVFCFGADFQGMSDGAAGGAREALGPEVLYDLWLKLSTGPYITISHVRGAANAGGMGFVSASDVVLADPSARFSLSELLFGLLPACVMPFLIRRIGFRKANYMTLMTSPVAVEQAHKWGLVDAWEENSASLLRRHLLRLRRLSKKGITRHKRYMNRLNESLVRSREPAVEANLEVFSDPENLRGIHRYVKEGKFPWET